MRQAILLAAGFSTRLRPLTHHIPKPLLPFWNQTLLDLNLQYLSSFSISSLAVNVHHGEKPFLKALEQVKNFTLSPFVEEKILGTGGGIKNMKAFVQDQTFLVLNCDMLTDVDLLKAWEFHQTKKAIATMVLLPGKPGQNYKQIGVDAEGKIVHFPYFSKKEKASTFGMFSGIHILDRSIFDFMPNENEFCINQKVYPRLLEEKKPVYGFFTPALWEDVGEIPLYARAQFELLQNPFSWMKKNLSKLKIIQKGVYVSPEVLLPESIKLIPPVFISEGSQIGENVLLGPNVILGPHSQIPSESHIQNSILFPKVSEPKALHLNHVIQTPQESISF